MANYDDYLWQKREHDVWKNIVSKPEVNKLIDMNAIVKQIELDLLEKLKPKEDLNPIGELIAAQGKIIQMQDVEIARLNAELEHLRRPDKEG